MQPEVWTKVISTAVVPVVLISACGLLCLAYYNRLAAIVGRIRAFQQEALKGQESLLSASDRSRTKVLRREWTAQTVEVFERQMKHLLRRGRLVRGTLLCLLAAAACLVLCSLALGASVLWPGMLYVAGPLFLAGLGAVLLALLLAALELRVALDPVELQSEFVERLGEEIDATGPVGEER